MIPILYCNLQRLHAVSISFRIEGEEAKFASRLPLHYICLFIVHSSSNSSPSSIVGGRQLGKGEGVCLVELLDGDGHVGARHRQHRPHRHHHRVHDGVAQGEHLGRAHRGG